MAEITRGYARVERELEKAGYSRLSGEDTEDRAMRVSREIGCGDLLTLHSCYIEARFRERLGEGTNERFEQARSRVLEALRAPQGKPG